MVASESANRAALSPGQNANLLAWALYGGVLPLSGYAFSQESTTIESKKFEHGQSNPTFLITISDQVRPLSPNEFKFVIRAKPKGKLLPGAHRIDREFKVLSALSRSEVPVPRVYGYCEHTDVIGSAFYAMEFLVGRIFTNANLRDVPDMAQRSEIYKEALRVLLALRKVDPIRLGLSELSKTKKPWIDRQIQTWYAQFRESRIPGTNYDEMEALHNRLQEERAKAVGDGESYHANSEKRLLVHGDFRLDNLVFHYKEPKCLGVLDWELVSLGDPIADLATFLVPFHLPAECTRIEILKPMVLETPRPSGIPSKESLIRMYSQDGTNQLFVVDHRLRVHLGLALFRLASIIYGVQSRAAQGNASSTSGAELGSQAHHFVRGALKVLDDKSSYMGGPRIGEKEAILSLKHKLWSFMKEEVLPLEKDYIRHVESDERWTPWSPLETLKKKAQRIRLWNLFLPKALGGSLSAVEYAQLAEITGHCVYAPEVFNCSAPDTGNMELLARYGTPEQKSQWLKPLLEGKIRSCFAMTEPDVASSDATNISTSIKKTKTGYVISGRKWWISGAMDPRCKVILLLGRGPVLSNGKHREHSILLIPMESRGIQVVRPLNVFGFDDAPHGHAEMTFNNVHVPHEALLHTEGGGFEAAQSRLGGGRLHHCMRMVGLGERALHAMTERSKRRVAFGKTLAQNEATLQRIGECRCDVDTMRAVVRSAAEEVDNGDINEIRRSLGVAKVVVARLGVRVVDSAIQIHGGMGVSQDTALAHMYAHARSLQLADGPDEVHLRNIARGEVRAKL